MTDPLEDRLRSHLADRAAQVTVAPDPSGVVERSAGRRRVGAPLVAGVVAVAAVVAGGSFATGLAVAGPRSTSTSTSQRTAPAPNVGGASTTVVGGGTAFHPATATAPVLTHLVTRTTDAGVTVRVYTSASYAVTTCTPGAPCVPGGGLPPTAGCPAGAMCVQPVTTPASGPVPPSGTGATTGSGGSSGSSGGAVTGTSVTGTVPTTTTVTTTPGSTSTTTSIPPTSACQQLTLELSTAQAVWTSSIPSPTTAGLAPKTVQLVDTGTFGGPEGAPVGYAVLIVSPDVASVRLSSPSGAVLDAMTPASGVVVLATTDPNGLAGTVVEGLDGGGATTAEARGDQGTTTAAGGCAVPMPSPLTTVPSGSGTTSTTGPIAPSAAPQGRPVSAATIPVRG